MSYNESAEAVTTDEYDPRKDAHDSYFVAIEAKRLRGDHIKPSNADRIEALERNLFALERLVHDLQKRISAGNYDEGS